MVEEAATSGPDYENMNTYQKLEALAGEAKDKPKLRQTFQTGSWGEKYAELRARHFDDAEIAGLSVDAQALTPEEQTKAMGYWLW
jgi:hypothetical protein